MKKSFRAFTRVAGFISVTATAPNSALAETTDFRSKAVDHAYYLLNPDGTNFVQLNAPSALSSNYTFTFPLDAGGAGEVLQSDGSGNTSWVSSLTNPMTTLGDIIFENSTPAADRLPGNTSTTKKFLSQTGTGSVSAAPAWSTIGTSDLPAATRTVAAAALQGGSKVRGYLSFTANAAANSYSVVPYDVELFDTNSEFDIATNYGRFTPTHAGYYSISCSAQILSVSGGSFLSVFKNGSRIAQSNSASGSPRFLVSDLVYLNGSSDYVDCQIWNPDGSNRDINSNGGDVSAATFSAVEMIN